MVQKNQGSAKQILHTQGSAVSAGLRSAAQDRTIFTVITYIRLHPNYEGCFRNKLKRPIIFCAS